MTNAIAYYWSLVPADTSQFPRLIGITSDLAGAQEMTGQALLEDDGAICVRIREVRPALWVSGIGPTYMATGPAWTGRRTLSGTVHWAEQSATIPA